MNMPLCSALMRLSNYKTECKIHACWSVSALISFSVLRANKVPAKTGTFLFTFGVWSCRRQRGESPKPDEKVVNKLFFLCIDFFVLSCGCGKFVKLLFCRVAVVQTCPKRNGKFVAYFGTTHIQALFLDCFEDALCFQNKSKRRSFFRRQQTKIVKHTM